MNKLGLSTALALTAIAAGPALAGNPFGQNLSMTEVCAFNPDCLKDKNGITAGIPFPNGVEFLEINNVWYQLYTKRSGLLISQPILYYNNTQCAGDADIYDPGYVPRVGTFDGTEIWTTPDGTDPITFQWQAYRYLDAQTHVWSQCVVYGLHCGTTGTEACTSQGNKAVSVVPPSLVPPFTMK